MVVCLILIKIFRYLSYKRDNELLLFILRGLATETATYMRNRSAETYFFLLIVSRLGTAQSKRCLRSMRKI